MVLLFRKGGLLVNKVTSRLIQGNLLSSIMGSSHSRSYAPNSGQCDNSEENRGTISVKEYVEAVVCKTDELQNDEMREFDIGNDGKVLLIKQDNEFSAIGTTCTHYGAPLKNGALGKGRVRCPWHGACFNIKTGDIEDFPGFDSLPCHEVTVTNGNVKVKASIADLKTNRRVKSGGKIPCTCEHPTVVIVGGGPSGATCAETLRGEGFTGRITVVCKENYLPYDRIKVSKIGVVTDIEKLQARTAEYYKESRIRVMKGTEAIKVNTRDKIVSLSDGSMLTYDSLYLSTGSKARVPTIPGIDLKNIFTVRNFDDSVNILKTLGTEKNKNVVVLGLSFIGLEIASSCTDKSKSMTVVGKDTAPLGQIFGNEIGQSLLKLFTDKGVKFQFETTITKCFGDDDNMITSVVLENGTLLPADVLILGVGTTYYTDFLKGSGINLNQDGSINVSNKLETNVNNVYAGGDIACAPVFAHDNKQMSIGHIGLAQYHGRIAALNILKKETPLKTVPFFWTMLFGKSIRYCGTGKATSTQIVGNVNELQFVIYFFNAADKVIAVASCMKDPIVAQFAEFLSQGKSLYKKDLKDDPSAWTKKS